MKNRTRWVLTFLLLFTGCIMHAQQSSEPVVDSVYRIEMKDGDVVTGKVISITADTLVIQTSLTESEALKRSDIEAITTLNAALWIKGTYWFENPSATRYLLGPSAIPLRRGEGYYLNMFGVMQNVQVGITNHISLGGGTEIGSLIMSQQAPSLFYLTTKVGYQVGKNMYAGGGLIYSGMPRASSYGGTTHFGIAYGMFTYGNYDHNVTLGVGWMGISEERYVNLWSHSRTKEVVSSPVIAVSGMYRVARRLSLVTENWMIPIDRDFYNTNSGLYEYTYTYRPIFSGGIRVIGERAALDFGLLYSPDFGSWFPVVPYFDFVVKFGPRKKKKKDS